MIIAEGKIGKVADFARHCNLSYMQLVNIIDDRKYIDFGTFQVIVNKIRELSPEYAYKFLKQQLLGEMPKWYYIYL